MIFGLLWELVVRVFDVQPFILMAPSRIVSELLDHPRFYLEAAAVTARQASIGLLIALGVAILLGAGLAASRFAEQATQPVLVLILVAPWVAVLHVDRRVAGPAATRRSSSWSPS